MNIIQYPEDFDEYAWEILSKGHFEATAVIDGTPVTVCFYDSQRLQQDTQRSEEAGEAFLPENIVIVEAVEKEKMDAAIKSFRL